MNKFTVEPIIGIVYFVTCTRKYIYNEPFVFPHESYPELGDEITIPDSDGDITLIVVAFNRDTKHIVTSPKQ